MVGILHKLRVATLEDRLEDGHHKVFYEKLMMTCIAFELRKWKKIAEMEKDTDDDEICLICRIGTSQLWECLHAAHLHCISRWLSIRNSCPLDHHYRDSLSKILLVGLTNKK
ncbi:unnamed protein product [Cochlearia groenlandica]